jgi:hypothetical protein
MPSISEDHLVALNKMSELRGQMLVDESLNYETGFRRVLDLVIADLMGGYPSEMTYTLAHEIGVIYYDE